MKKILPLAAFLIAAVSLQAYEGFYVGAEAGMGFLNKAPKKSELRAVVLEGSTVLSSTNSSTSVTATTTTTITNGVKRKKAHFIGGIHMGYTFDIDEQCSIAPQIGYRYVQKGRYRSTGTITSSVTYSNAATAAPQVKTVEGDFINASHHLNVIDLLAVGTYRMNSAWDIQGKIGAALVMDKIRFESLTDSLSQSNPTVYASYSKKKKSIRPELGISFGYALQENLRLSVDAAHIFGSRSKITPLVLKQSAVDSTTGTPIPNQADIDALKASQEACYNAFRKVPSLTTVTVALQFRF